MTPTTHPRHLAVIGGLGRLASADLYGKLVKALAIRGETDRYRLTLEQRHYDRPCGHYTEPVDMGGRDLYLYDTFTGMAEPGPRDTDFRGRSALDIWRRATHGEVTDWCLATEAEARTNVLSTGYPADRITLVPGRVEDTIPAVAPKEIAVLRLDTDWYDSTHHELVHLFPRLSVGGVLIVDDYGYWRGAREATDEYLRESGARLLLCRIDHAARQGVKP